MTPGSSRGSEARARRCPLRSSTSVVHSPEPGAPGWVPVSVRNTGGGIPVEFQDRIFQPFFTTKSRGTGLGLAIARQIVEAHRGHVSVVSDGVSEATFVADLPAAPAVGAVPRGDPPWGAWLNAS